ncbi:universal stress protein [Chloroflexota bacterium]
MYQKIMVPLDGSKLAECVLPHLEVIATGCEAGQVVLISVTERVPVRQTYHATGSSTRSDQLLNLTFSGSENIPDPGIPLDEPFYAGAVGRKEKQARRYLDRIAKSLIKKGLSVSTEVLLGPPADQIAAYATHNEADLIIISTHGRSGISRWVMGSVADRVLRSSCVPVLMVRAPGCLPGI